MNQISSSMNRRDFLKLTTAGAAALALHARFLEPTGTWFLRKPSKAPTCSLAFATDLSPRAPPQCARLSRH